MKKIFTIYLIFIFSLSVLAKNPGQDILEKSDAKIIPSQCSYNISIESSDGDSQKLQGYKKTHDNLLVVKEPKRVAGSAYLRKKNIIWSYYTTNHKTVKVAYQAVFMGTLLNFGDIMATALSDDYDVIKVDEDPQFYILNLTSKPNHDGYKKILLTVDKKTYLPHMRSYYAVSGVLIKQSTFKNIEKDSLEIEFVEPLKKQKTTVTFTNINKDASIPMKWFNENYLDQINQK